MAFNQRKLIILFQLDFVCLEPSANRRTSFHRFQKSGEKCIYWKDVELNLKNFDSLIEKNFLQGKT